jgi:hypothetical protein
MQSSNYIRLNHTLDPSHYQGCTVEPIQVDYYNPYKKDDNQKEFFLTKVKYARQ